MTLPQPKVAAPTAADGASVDDLRATLLSEVARLEEQSRRRKANWSVWYYGCLYGSVALSALSALILKLEFVTGPWQKDVAALFASTAAILGTVKAAGNFERRWRAARHGEVAIAQLRIELADPNADVFAIKRQLLQAMTRYEDEVLGTAN
jgi:hypothetical protein